MAQPRAALPLDGNGIASETVRHADVVSFTCLKAFAFDQRFEPKDAHDLIYCIEHARGGFGRRCAVYSRSPGGQAQ